MKKITDICEICRKLCKKTGKIIVFPEARRENEHLKNQFVEIYVKMVESVWPRSHTVNTDVLSPTAGVEVGQRAVQAALTGFERGTGRRRCNRSLWEVSSLRDVARSADLSWNAGTLERGSRVRKS